MRGQISENSSYVFQIRPKNLYFQPSEDQSGALEVFGMKIEARVALDNIY